MDILQKIRDLYPDLTKKQKGIAEYLLENPEDICYITLAQLSQQTSASELTLLRFCQKIGCTNFLDLKNEFREYTQRMVKLLSSPTYFVPEEPPTKRESLLMDICQEEANAAADFAASFKPETIISAAAEIRQSKRIFIFAHDISRVLAEFLESRLRLLYFNATFIDVSDLAETQNRLLNLCEGDFVVFFSFPKYYFPMGSIAKKVADAAVPILTITDSISSPAAQYSTHLLLCQTSTKMFYNSLALPMTTLNLLTSYLVIDMVPASEQNDFKKTLSS